MVIKANSIYTYMIRYNASGSKYLSLHSLAVTLWTSQAMERVTQLGLS